MAPRTYLDVASVAPLTGAARAAAARAAEIAWADPTRPHREGRAASDLLSSARQAGAATLGGAAERTVFTSGGTESVHLAVRGVAAANRRRRRRIVSSAVEHSAVLAAAEAVARATEVEHVVVGVDEVGRIRLDELAAALEGGALLVNIQHANHEVGTLQPVTEVARRCRAVDAFLHVDACQTVGRLPVRLDEIGADLLSLSAAKIGAGAGAGALLWSPRARLFGLATGDEREHRLRAGLQNLGRVAALAETLLQLSPSDPRGAAAAEAARADGLRRLLRELLAGVEDVVVHGPEDDTLPNLVSVSALYVEGQALAVALDDAGFAVHTGSSCASTSGEPSHVLAAMGALTSGHVRISFGPDVGVDDLERFAATFGQVVGDLRRSLGR